ncbi:MAG TPA: hypothetical protein VIO64_10720 [Pseudobacteroides sp.]|uniref:hypothetical protein n=1 Tax=Pseudobacteroides sp. TaxID=1968840 RepID=UPI002F92629D
MSYLISSKQVDIDRSVTWANNAVVNTSVTINFTKPAQPVDKYQITFDNQSLETSVTCNVYALKTINGVQKPSHIGVLSYAANAVQSKTIENIFVNADLRLVFSNGSAIVTGFTGYVKIEEVM